MSQVSDGCRRAATWSCFLSSQFKPYETDISAAIEASYQKGLTEANFQMNGVDYTINFTSMRQHKVSDPNRTRKVQRQEANDDHDAVAQAPPADSSLAQSPPLAKETVAEFLSRNGSCHGENSVEPAECLGTPTPGALSDELDAGSLTPVPVRALNSAHLSPGTSDELGRVNGLKPLSSSYEMGGTQVIDEGYEDESEPPDEEITYCESPHPRHATR